MSVRRNHRDRLEIHVPISPNPLFFNRMHYLAASMAVYGGVLADTRIVVTAGADEEPFDLAGANPWARHYPVEWRWLDRHLYRKYLYWGTRAQRFCYRYRADVVLMLDPDILVVRPFDDLIDEVAAADAFSGITAHASPVRGDFSWEHLFAAGGLGVPLLQCEHSGFGLVFEDASRRLCPPYFNLGVLASPASHVRRIGRTIFRELDTVMPIEDFFRAQTSLLLAMVRQQIPWQLMSLKYNFPNDLRFLERYRSEFEDMRLVHYLRKDQFDKEADFASPRQIGELIQRQDLHKVNRAFMDRLTPVHERVLADL